MATAIWASTLRAFARTNRIPVDTSSSSGPGYIETLSLIDYAARVVIAAGAVTVTTADKYIGINKTTGAATVVNLPATPPTGFYVIIKDEKLDAATNNITLTPAAGNIVGATRAATYVMNTAGQSATVIYNGTEWTVN